MLLAAADYPFLNVFWTILVVFVWVIWLFLLFRCLMDVFRRQDTSGFTKVIWVIFMIILPYLGVFIYLIVNGHGMAERDQRQAQAAQASFDSYVQTVAASSGPAGEIEKAKALLDSGAISQQEFDALKAKALSS